MKDRGREGGYCDKVALSCKVTEGKSGNEGEMRGRMDEKEVNQDEGKHGKGEKEEMKGCKMWESSNCQ